MSYQKYIKLTDLKKLWDEGKILKEDEMEFLKFMAKAINTAGFTSSVKHIIL
jgi:hypothetical protein